MSETIATWLMGLVSNSSLVVGILLILIAVFLKDEKSTQSPRFKPATLFKKTLNPLPTLAYRFLIGLGLIGISVGFLQISIVSGGKSPSISPDSKEVSIESFPIKVFDYDGVGDSQVQQGWAKLAITFSGQKAHYLFDYELPSDGTFGYAGLDFRFEQTQDLTKYKVIKLVLVYPDETTQCELFLKDISFQGDYILLGRATPPGGSLKITGTEYLYEVPLSNFTKPDLKAIYEVGLSVDTDITMGKHQITVKQISFVR